MGDRYIKLQEKMALAALTDEQLELHVPFEGTWILEECWLGVHTTTAADATHYITVAVKKGAGGTTLGSITTASTALTKGTIREIPLTTAPASNLITGQSTAIELTVTNSGANGAAADFTAFFGLRKLVS